MREPEDVRVRHLVVDASAFIKNVQLQVRASGGVRSCPQRHGVALLQDIAAFIYTLPAVVGEIRDAATKERLKCLPYEIKLQQPSDASLKLGELVTTM